MEAAAAARIQASEADIDALEQRSAIIAARQVDQRARLAERQQPLVRLVAALQGMALQPPALLLVQPGSLDDIAHVRAVLDVVLPTIRARTAALRGDVARGRALATAADQLLAGRRNAQAQLVAQRTALARFAVLRRAAADRLTGGAIVEQDNVLALGEEARDMTDLVRKLERQSLVRARLETLSGPVIRPAQPGLQQAMPTDRPAQQPRQASYRLPVVGTLVAGMGEISEAGVRTRGLTLATRPSALVVAPTGGRIAFAGPYRGYGNIVIVDHGGGWTTLLTSLATLDVKVGDQVDRGSPIGRAGLARPTVTVELRRGGQPVDITRLLG